MRRTFVIVCLTACVTTSATPRSSVDVLLRNAAELKLTETQRADLQAIDDRRFNKAERLRIDAVLKHIDRSGGYGDSNQRVEDEADRDLSRRRGARVEIGWLDAEALKEAEAKLDADQKALARSFVDRWLSERRATAEDDED